MNYKELIARYIYAVSKNLPYKGRMDIEREIETLIYDMLEERCGDMTPTEKDVRVVLAELGTPEELADNYSPDKDKCLIGPPYYSRWKWFMKIILPAAGVGLLVANFIIVLGIVSAAGDSMTPMNIVLEIFSRVGNIFGVLAQTAAAITIVFAILQRKNISLSWITGTQWETTPVPKKEEIISRKGVAGSIVFSIIFYIVFLCVPQILGVRIMRDGIYTYVPVLSQEMIRSTWYLLTAYAVLGIIRDMVKYIEGRYTMRLAAVAGICNLLSLLCAVWWLTAYDIINPKFPHYMARLFEGEEIFGAKIFTNFQTVFLGCIIFSLVLDFGETLWKAVKYKIKAS